MNLPWYQVLAIWLSPLHWRTLLHAFYHDLRPQITAEIIQLKTQAYDYSCDLIANINLFLVKRWDDAGFSSDSHLPRTFHHFSALPTEIRLLIWQHALPGPRVIEIRTSNISIGIHNSYRWLKPRSICRIPTLLHVCRESRTEALKRYQLSFGLETTRYLGTLRTAPGIFIDFEKDIVFFGQKSNYSAMQLGTREGEFKGLEKVRRMAMGTQDGRGGNVVYDIDFGVLKGVKELIFVAQTGGERIFDLGKEPNLVLFEDADWSRKLEEIGALRALMNMRRLLEEVDWRRRSEELGTWDGDEWTSFGDEEWEYDFERDYQGLPQVEVRIGTFVKGVGDRW